MAAHVVAIANRKGGVGKTTLTLSLAEGLAALKHKRVLVVDLDPTNQRQHPHRRRHSREQGAMEDWKIYRGPH